MAEQKREDDYDRRVAETDRRLTAFQEVIEETARYCAERGFIVSTMDEDVPAYTIIQLSPDPNAKSSLEAHLFVEEQRKTNTWLFIQTERRRISNLDAKMEEIEAALKSETDWGHTLEMAFKAEKQMRISVGRQLSQEKAQNDALEKELETLQVELDTERKQRASLTQSGQ